MYVPVITYVLCLLSVGWGGDPPGHLQPLGSHMTPLSIDEISHYPHPIQFYDEYMRYGKPVLFKSILQETGSKAMKLWTDDYMRTNFGETTVMVESGKKEDRRADLNEMTLTEYLDSYETKDIYLVQDLTERMKEDVPLPYSIRCGGPQTMLTKAIMWFSSGGTKSVLHMDESENINCLLDGSKDFILFDRIHGEDIEADGYDWQGSYSTVDVDRVDMHTFPRIQHLPYYKVHMDRGDCLYIPTGMYHQVNSYGSRNLAVNIWFYHQLWFNLTDCAGDSWNTTKTMNHYPYASVADGLRDMMIEPLEMQDSMTEDEFLDKWYYISIDEVENSKLFHHIDADHDGTLNWKELYAFDVDEVYRSYPKAFGNDFREYYRQKKHMYEELFGPHQEEKIFKGKDEL